MNGSFLDTGSNSLYFGTAVMSTTCTRSTGSFYCPPTNSPVTFSAVLSGSNGMSANTGVGNATVTGPYYAF